MLVKILVTAHIGVVDLHAGAVPEADKLRASVCEAINNALARGADNGFDHKLSGTTSIAVESVTLADGRPGGDEPETFVSWVEAAENIPAGDIWIPRIIYDERPDGWHWSDAASNDGWSGPYTDREAAANAACEHNDFHPQVERTTGRPHSL